MKKIFAIVITVAMILSMGAMLVNAELPYLPAGHNFQSGGYSDEDEPFEPAGDFDITWDPEASSKLDLSDGNMDDWAANYENMVQIDASNMIYWRKDATGVPAGWNISTYFVADSDYLYIGFYVTDPVFAYGGSSGYTGDAFQVCIDFGGRLGDMLRNDPENLDNPKNVFYSFSCVSDGAPLIINRQECGEASGKWTPLSEANGDGVKGSASKTNTGWCAEFALSWEQMYDDYTWKAWEDPTIYVGGDENRPLKIGCCLYYLDRTVSGGDIHWAAGSTNGITDDNGRPQISWTAYDNGLNLSLTYEEGMVINCRGIEALDLTATIPEDTEAPETDPETAAPETVPETAPETVPETDAETKAETKAPETEPVDGCGSIIGFSAVAILAAAAAAVALKKD